LEDEEAKAEAEEWSTNAGMVWWDPDPSLASVLLRPNRCCCLDCEELPVPGALILLLGESALAGAVVIVVTGVVDLLGISSDLMTLKTKRASVT
jgi:hypothetical protein